MTTRSSRIVHRRTNWPTMDPSSSLTSSQFSVDTYESYIWRRQAIIPRPLGRSNGLKWGLPPDSTTTWPSIRPTGIRFSNHWRMPTKHKCIVRRERRRLVSYCLVTCRFLHCLICHCRYRPICGHHQSPLISRALYAKTRNAPNKYQLIIGEHSSALETRLWQVGLRNSNVPTGTYVFVHRPLEQLTTAACVAEEPCSKLLFLLKDVRPFRIVSTIADNISIDELGIHYPMSIGRITRTVEETDVTDETDKTSLPKEMCKRSLTGQSTNDGSDESECPPEMIIQHILTSKTFDMSSVGAGTSHAATQSKLAITSYMTLFLDVGLAHIVYCSHQRNKRRRYWIK